MKIIEITDQKNTLAKIIPFGKYKGQPIEVLQQDTQYMDWLTGQDWFRQKFQPIYNVIINNFQEPTETPEHNQMQVKFLKEEWRVKLAYLLQSQLFTYNPTYLRTHIKEYCTHIHALVKEVAAILHSRLELYEQAWEKQQTYKTEDSIGSPFLTIDIPECPFRSNGELMTIDFYFGSSPKDKIDKINSQIDKLLLYLQTFQQAFIAYDSKFLWCPVGQFELSSGFDVYVHGSYGFNVDILDELIDKDSEYNTLRSFFNEIKHATFCSVLKHDTSKKALIQKIDWKECFKKEIEFRYNIELKPCLGDDFPAILRQIKANRKNITKGEKIVLLIKTFTGQGATFEEVKQIFQASNISIVTEKEIEQLSLPEFEQDIRFIPEDFLSIQESIARLEEIINNPVQQGHVF